MLYMYSVVHCTVDCMAQVAQVVSHCTLVQTQNGRDLLVLSRPAQDLGDGHGNQTGRDLQCVWAGYSTDELKLGWRAVHEKMWLQHLRI